MQQREVLAAEAELRTTYAYPGEAPALIFGCAEQLVLAIDGEAERFIERFRTYENAMVMTATPPSSRLELL